MRFFQFRASDSAGRSRQGTLQAISVVDAQRQLTAGGLKVTDLRELHASGAAPSAAPTMSRPAPSAVKSPDIGLRPTPVGPAPVPWNQASTVATTRRTRRGGDKENFLLFAQVARYLRSGIAPQRAFSELAARERALAYQVALKRVADRVAEGGTISDALEEFPYLFPPDVAGTVRAGEVGGFLAEACEEVSTHAEQSHKLKRRFFYFTLILYFAILFWPVGMALIQGSLETISAQWEADGKLSPVGTLTRFVGSSIVQALPVIAAVYIGTIVLYRIWIAMPARMARHSVILRTPGLAARAKSESLARAAWVMTRVSRSGLPPQRVLELGAASMPNLVLRERLMGEATRMRESERLSTVIGRTGMVPPQYSDILETGEITGDMPGAINDVHRAVDAEYQSHNSVILWKFGTLLYLLLGLLIAVIVYLMATKLYNGLFERIQ